LWFLGHSDWGKKVFSKCLNVECHELLNYAMVRSIGLNHYVYEHECELGLGKELGIDVLEDN